MPQTTPLKEKLNDDAKYAYRVKIADTYTTLLL